MHTHTAFVEALNKILTERLFKVQDAQELNDPEKVSLRWVKHLYGLVDELNDTETEMIGMKPKDAIKLDEVPLVARESYLSEEVLPDNGLYRYLLQPGEEIDPIVIDPIPEYFNDNISPCDSNACLTCNSFISDQSFKSNLTGRIYKTQTYEQLTCGSLNVVYAIHCIRCGLMYVGETGRSVKSRINGHRAGIIKDGQSLLYKHFHLPGHSVVDMKVQILEKIYHSSENPVNIRLHRRLRELHWIKKLGTAAPYGCNDQIKGVGTLCSPSCKHTNVLGIFNKQHRRKRSHGHRHYNKKTPQLDSSIDTLVNLIDSIDQPQGVHKIKTTLFSIFLPKLCELQSLALESTNYDYESAEYRVTAIILDTAPHRLFRPVRSDILSTDAKTHFIKLDFINKGIDAVKLWLAVMVNFLDPKQIKDNNILTQHQ